MICGLAMLFGECFPGYVEDAGWRDHVRKLMLDGSGIWLSEHSTVTTEVIINHQDHHHLQFRNMLIMLHVFAFESSSPGSAGFCLSILSLIGLSIMNSNLTKYNNHPKNPPAF